MEFSIARGRNIVFYDNACMLCHWSVRFIAKHDKKDQFVFAPLQGVVWGQLSEAMKASATMESVLYFDGKSLTEKSDAALNILRQLGGFWKLFGLLNIIPRRWRNGLYDFIARNRHSWFGQPTECSLENQIPAGKILD